MARLFITPREIDFISDITKEITKDVMGQKIYYYHVREDLTEVHEIYEEAIDKVFDPPIEMEGMVEWQPEEFSTTRYGSEESTKISVYLHARDLLDKDLEAKEGDYFSYGTVFFEVTSVIADKQIFGQVEHLTGFKIAGVQAREGQINVRPHGPLSESLTDEDAVQTTFAQQRGAPENSLGETGDVRQLQANGKLDKPITGPKEVASKGGIATTDSSFYGD